PHGGPRRSALPREDPRTSGGARSPGRLPLPRPRPGAGGGASTGLRILAGMTAAPETAVVLTVGNEIVSGDIENTNASWLSRRLASRGVHARFLPRGGA